MSASRCHPLCEEHVTMVTSISVFRCHPSCEDCVGSTHKDCVSCKSPLKLAGSVCEETCPSGKYDEDYSCRNCHTGCLTCRGPGDTDCLSCSKPRWVILIQISCLYSNFFSFFIMGNNNNLAMYVVHKLIT